MIALLKGKKKRCVNVDVIKEGKFLTFFLSTNLGCSFGKPIPSVEGCRDQMQVATLSEQSNYVNLRSNEPFGN